jgi:hypothetical protein
MVDPVAVVIGATGGTLLILFGLGMEMTFEGNSLVRINFFKSVEITEVGFFLQRLLPRWVQTLCYLFLLGGIALVCARWAARLRDPLLGVLLASGATRVEILIYEFIGNLAGAAVGLALFTFGMITVLLCKGGGVGSVVAGTASLLWWLAVLSSWTLLLTLLTDHPLSVMVILVAIVFLIGPLLSGLAIRGRPELFAIVWILPPAQSMVDYSVSLFLNQPPPDLPLPPLTVAPAAFLLLSAEMFERKDLLG